MHPVGEMKPIINRDEMLPEGLGYPKLEIGLVQASERKEYEDKRDGYWRGYAKASFR